MSETGRGGAAQCGIRACARPASPRRVWAGGAHHSHSGGALCGDLLAVGGGGFEVLEGGQLLRPLPQGAAALVPGCGWSERETQNNSLRRRDEREDPRGSRHITILILPAQTSIRLLLAGIHARNSTRMLLVGIHAQPPG